jgi:hypothetical protein
LATYLGGVLRVCWRRGCIKREVSHKLIKISQGFYNLFSKSKIEKILKEEKGSKMIAREEKEEEKRQLPVTLLSGFLVNTNIAPCLPILLELIQYGYHTIGKRQNNPSRTHPKIPLPRTAHCGDRQRYELVRLSHSPLHPHLFPSTRNPTNPSSLLLA